MTKDDLQHALDALPTIQAALTAELAALDVVPSPPPPPPGVASKVILTPDDFEYLGLITMPADPKDQDGQATRFGFAWGGISGRVVNGETRLFITGSIPNGWHQPLYELRLPEPAITADLKSAPRAELVHAWGDIYQGRMAIYHPSAPTSAGIFWDGQYLWWTYGDPYNASSTSWDPSIGCTRLNEDGTVEVFGPWRTSVHSQQTRGYLLSTPLGMMAGAGQTSGNVACPFGPALFALTGIDPRSTAADPVQTTAVYTGHEPQSIPARALLFNDIKHPAARDAEFFACGWQVKYDCSQGSLLNPGKPTWQNNDSCEAAVWIEGPSAHGVLFCGNLVHGEPGASEDQWPHNWYGPQTCCHGRVAKKAWGATGPGTDSMMPWWFIYDPADVQAVAAGTKDPSALTPTTSRNMFEVYGTDVGMAAHGGAWFDETSGRLYVSTRNEDTVTNHYDPRPVVRVFRLKVPAA